MPDVSLPTNVMHYPTRLIAPDAFNTTAEHPIGTGPFKFVSWTRNNEAKLVRFENYWETDAEGHNLPYLDEIIGKPKNENSVRLTALRTGQVQLINSMAQADVERFTKTYSDKYNIWQWHGGGNFVVFNFRRGPFQDKRLRIAAAHAIDRDAIHHTVYYGHGDILDQPYPRGNPGTWRASAPWSMTLTRPSLCSKRRVPWAPRSKSSAWNNTIQRESAQVIQDLWNTVGFKVTVEPLDTVPWREARSQGMHPAAIQGNTFRYDPDDYFARNLHSKSDYSNVLSGWQNAKYDGLVEEAKRTLDSARRKELYTEAWNLVTVELPFFYLHEVVNTSAADKKLAGLPAGQGGRDTLPRRRLSHRLYWSITRAARQCSPARRAASALTRSGGDGSTHSGKGS